MHQDLATLQPGQDRSDSVHRRDRGGRAARHSKIQLRSPSPLHYASPRNRLFDANAIRRDRYYGQRAADRACKKVSLSPKCGIHSLLPVHLGAEEASSNPTIHVDFAYNNSLLQMEDVRPASAVHGHGRALSQSTSTDRHYRYAYAMPRYNPLHRENRIRKNHSNGVEVEPITTH